MVDFNEILESEIFTFLVGPNKKPFRIHSALVRGLSEPLNVMINGSVGGKMQDAIQMEASIEDVDPQTFVHFSEFAYTGIYRAPPKAPVKAQKTITNPRAFLDISQVSAVSTNSAPQANPLVGNHLTQSNGFLENPLSQTTLFFGGQPQQSRGIFGTPVAQFSYTANDRSQASTPIAFSSTTPTGASELFCHGCGRPKRGQTASRDTCDRSSYCIRQGSRFSCIQCGAMTGVADQKYCSNCLPAQSPKEPPSGLGREYPALGMSHAELCHYLDGLRPVDPISDCLSCHSKLFIFANKYMIESLKQLCLHKLYRDLEKFNLAQGNISEVIRMMSYAYDNTSEDDEGAVGQELRELVMAYATLKAKELVKYEEFKDMLTEGGELAAAFACAVANRLTT